METITSKQGNERKATMETITTKQGNERITIILLVLKSHCLLLI